MIPRLASLARRALPLAFAAGVGVSGSRGARLTPAVRAARLARIETLSRPPAIPESANAAARPFVRSAPRRAPVSRAIRESRDRPLLERLLRERVADGGAFSLPVARLEVRLARADLVRGDRRGAARRFERALEIFRAKKGSDARETIQVASEAAEMRRRLRDGRGAEGRLREAFAASVAATGPFGPGHATDGQAEDAARRAAAACKAGRLREACMLYSRALAGWRKIYPPDHPKIIRGRWLLTRILRRMADPHEVSGEMTAANHREFWRRCLKFDEVAPREAMRFPREVAGGRCAGEPGPFAFLRPGAGGEGGGHGSAARASCSR